MVLESKKLPVFQAAFERTTVLLSSVAEIRIDSAAAKRDLEQEHLRSQASDGSTSSIHKLLIPQ